MRVIPSILRLVVPILILFLPSCEAGEQPVDRVAPLEIQQELSEKTQISRKPSPAKWESGKNTSSNAQNTTYTSTIIVKEGRGFHGINVDDSKCNMEFIKSKLGTPDEETDKWLSYKSRYGLDFWMASSAGPLREIRLNRGFKGRLASNISLSSPMEDVFKVYGKSVSEQTVDDLRGHFNDRTLYRAGNRGKIFYNGHGLLFWFSGNQISQIVIHPKRGTAPRIKPLPAPVTPKLAKEPEIPDITGDREYPRWLPLIRIDKLWNYVKLLWIYWYFTLAALLIIIYLSKSPLRRLYYRWRPLPEGRLLMVHDPTGDEIANINIWYEARQLKKRRLLIGSGKEADIRLPHKSVDKHHALILAQRFEGGVRTFIQRIGTSKVIVNDARRDIMPLVKNAEVHIGEFMFQYEKPSEYRQVQVRYKSGKVIEGVPTSWDINAEGFTLIPSKAPSWNDARIIRFGKLKGIYFVRDWDEDIREKLLKREKTLHNHPATVRFTDNEVLPGYLLGGYKEDMRRFYFFPDDQSGDTVYILVERTSIKSLKRGTHPLAGHD